MGTPTEIIERFDIWEKITNENPDLEPHQIELLKLMTDYEKWYVRTQPLPDDLFVIS